jgi:hypothetical protein
MKRHLHWRPLAAVATLAVAVLALLLAMPGQAEPLATQVQQQR